MKQRTITAVIALILFIPIVVAGGYWIDWLAAALAAVGISEIFLMKKQILLSIDFLLALLATLTWTVPKTFFNVFPKEVTRPGIYFTMVMLLLTWTVLSKNKTSFDDVGVYTLASLYIGTGFHYLAAIRNIDHGSMLGLALLGYVFVVVWSTDIGAYMIGKKFGKHKLWPVISPNKTWEGSIGAVVCAIAFSAIYINVVPLVKDYSYLIWTSAILSIVGQMGDLVESAYKRYYGVKDSGKILPGHGGILDRFDSMLFVLPVIALFFIKG
ncbi:phosphatidate cytidylyltransferase [Lactobacillus mulieris]|jgi:cytidylyltransferase family|uniref:Phosphatidate cytidylyltransferase n=1 Tax=Lactobacillus mulieris TaxID=2508708 RepID=A0AAP3GV32_9LACO|nr:MULTISPECIES: phosphatidate cytidylyltransferase [Lactobacillus]EEU21514.1 hypothetical protein HMPREF0525_00448 [Lactobacillus jensenii 27-2-CHN]EEX24385.1 phosphatidate cytidylyltransferase [Lactobacillus jensenii 115-3-CHN]EFH29555.1 phosphatidate cytidylyltransferase [Lactobacillus jensenii JV-V16]KAA9244944.1 phosphatidate cytidylyltransferase [Lactobacillus jensenii]KAA9370395.1 phosphatidate cytidylyltransferase [Lactobacillus jensenii]